MFDKLLVLLIHNSHPLEMSNVQGQGEKLTAQLRSSVVIIKMF